MSFAKAKRRLQLIINRKDLTDALAAEFINDSMADLERNLRLGGMEVVLTQQDWDGVKNEVIVPPGYLETLNFFTDTKELTMCDLSVFLALEDQGGEPTHYVKIADRWLLRPTPAAGTKVHLHCYSQSPALIADTDENLWTRAALGALTYQAASLAADIFQMEDQHVARFQGRADRYAAEMAAQDLNENWSGRISIPLPSNSGSY